MVEIRAQLFLVALLVLLGQRQSLLRRLSTRIAMPFDRRFELELLARLHHRPCHRHRLGNRGVVVAELDVDVLGTGFLEGRQFRPGFFYRGDIDSTDELKPVLGASRGDLGISPGAEADKASVLGRADFAVPSTTARPLTGNWSTSMLQHRV